MLGPFRLKNFRRSALLPLPTPDTRGSTSGTDVVLSVHGDVYDWSARCNPASRLKYKDGDGEMITVGSTEELADRLAEPIRPRRRRDDRDFEVSLRPASPSMHVFEIDPLRTAVMFWRKIEAEEWQRTEDESRQREEPAAGDKASHSSTVQPAGELTTTDVVDNIPWYPTLEDMMAAHFKNSDPPGTGDQKTPAEPFSKAPNTMAETTGHQNTAARSSDASINVLTSEGIKQAQQAGEQLRARLMGATPNQPRSRIDRASAVNSWATYSKPSVPIPVINPKHHCIPELTRPIDLPSYPANPFASDSYRPSYDLQVMNRQVQIANQTPIERPTLPPLITVLGRAPPSGPTEAASGALRPAFYENVQASLAKLSPALAKSYPMGGPHEGSNQSPELVTPAKADAAPATKDADTDSSEAVEITLAKMVFQSIRDMAKTLDTMNTQFDALLTPKLVAERLKSKDKLLPAHRQDTVRDIFALRRAIEQFALEVAETKQTLGRFDNPQVFPEGTNLMDFNSMTSAAYSFGRMIRSMDDMIIAARRGMLPAKVADGEPKFHTPRRLARLGYDDIWSINIVPIPQHFSGTNVLNLIDEVRSEQALRPLDIRHIAFREGSERSVEVEIQGKAQAVETWNCLLHAPKRSIRLPLSERQITLNRKHYPDVLRYSGAAAKEEDKAPAAPLPPPNRADIDVARLKALQDRRATWRKEFKARTQSVRFQAPLEAKTAQEKTSVSEHSAKREPSTTATSSTQAPTDEPKHDNPRVLSQRKRREDNRRMMYEFEEKRERLADRRRHLSGHFADSYVQLPSSVNGIGLDKPLRRARSENFGKKGKEKATPLDSSKESALPPNHPAVRFHALRYPPGPFPPPPPQRAQRGSSELCNTQNKLPSELYKATQSGFRPEHGPVSLASASNEKLQSAPFIPAFPPLPPLEPLIPQRAQPLPPLDPLKPQHAQPMAPVPVSEPNASARPETDAQGKESSGAFFRRMTGRSPAPSHRGISPMSSPTLAATQPGESIQRPVSPISLQHEPLSRHKAAAPVVRFRPALSGHVGDHSYALAEKSASGPWSRRPYSMTFDGSGRTDTYGQRLYRPYAERERPISMAADGSSERANVLRDLDRLRSATASGSTSAALRPTPARQSLFVASAPAPPLVAATDSPLAATVPAGPTADDQPIQSIKVQECVDQLQALGYGDKHNGGMGRLVMYTQLADGDLGAAIDLIEEEREAWQEHGSPAAAEPSGHEGGEESDSWRRR